MTTGPVGTEAAEAVSGQPNETDRTGQTAGAAATQADAQATNGNASTSPPGLDSLPGELRETLKDLPPESWAAHVKVYKSMQSRTDRAIQEATNERKRLEALARNGETLEKFAKHPNPKVRESLWALGQLASQDSQVAPEDDDAAIGERLLTDTEPQKFGRAFRAEVRREAERIVEQRLAQRDDATRQADDALTSAFAAVRDGIGERLTDEQWASVAAKAWKEHGGRDGFTPDTVAAKMLPYVLDAVETTRGKPAIPARAAKAASLMGQTGTVQPADDVPAWVAQKRAPTRAEGVAHMLKITGAKSAKDFMAAWHGTMRG